MIIHRLVLPLEVHMRKEELVVHPQVHIFPQEDYNLVPKTIHMIHMILTILMSQVIQIDILKQVPMKVN